MAKFTRSLWAGCLSAVIGLGALAPAGAKQSPEDRVDTGLAVLAYTGSLTIEVDGEKVFVPFGAIPPRIRAGAEVSVLSGSAVFANDRLAIKVKSGAKFKYQAQRVKGVLKVLVSADPRSTVVTAEIGGRLVRIPAKAAATFYIPATGLAVVSARKGALTLLTASGKTRIIREGRQETIAVEGDKSAWAQVAEEPEAPAPWRLEPSPETTDLDVRVSPSSP